MTKNIFDFKEDYPEFVKVIAPNKFKIKEYSVIKMVISIIFLYVLIPLICIVLIALVSDLIMPRNSLTQFVESIFNIITGFDRSGFEMQDNNIYFHTGCFSIPILLTLIYLKYKSQYIIIDVEKQELIVKRRLLFYFSKKIIPFNEIKGFKTKAVSAASRSFNMSNDDFEKRYDLYLITRKNDSILIFDSSDDKYFYNDLEKLIKHLGWLEPEKPVTNEEQFNFKHKYDSD